MDDDLHALEELISENATLFSDEHYRQMMLRLKRIFDNSHRLEAPLFHYERTRRIDVIYFIVQMVIIMIPVLLMVARPCTKER